MLRSPSQQGACCHKTGTVWETHGRHPVLQGVGCLTAHQRQSPSVGRVSVSVTRHAACLSVGLRDETANPTYRVQAL